MAAAGSEKWTTKMAAWEKRVHVTHLVRKGYDKACKEYDFERNATKLGCYSPPTAPATTCLTKDVWGPEKKWVLLESA